MPAGARIRRRARRDHTVVASRAASRDVRVVEGPVRIQQHEALGRVAIAAFLRGNDVVVGLAGCGDAIVAAAAAAEHLVVVDEARGVEA